jgi:orotidine-5'-phosphate decarboxylase
MSGGNMKHINNGKKKSFVINLDRIPEKEWARIFEATAGTDPVFKLGTTIQRKSVQVIDLVKEHGRVMIDTRLGEYLPDVVECIQMYKEYEPWGITFRAGNDFAMNEAQAHQILSSAIVSVRVAGSDEECRRRNNATCDEVIIKLVHGSRDVGMTRILCSMRELAVIRRDTGCDHMECIIYGNYPLWHLDPGVSFPAAIARPDDAFTAGADYVLLAAPVTIARVVPDPVGLLIEAYQEFMK